MASWLQRAQKKFLGKVLVGSELHLLAQAHGYGATLLVRTERTPSGRRQAVRLWGRLRRSPW
jgi:hypothetical protein